MTGDLADERYVPLTTRMGDGPPEAHTDLDRRAGPEGVGWLPGPGRLYERFEVVEGAAHPQKPCRRTPAQRHRRSLASRVIADSRAGLSRPRPGVRAIRRAVRRKHGLEDFKISLQEIPARLRGRGLLSDCAVVITLAG